MWTTKSPESKLVRTTVIRIAVIEGRACPCEDQKRVEVSLEQNVDVNPLSNVAAITHVTRHRIESIWSLCDSSLNCEPGVEVSHVVNAGHGCRDLLFEFVRAEVAVLIKELRQVWPKSVARCQSTKERCCGNCAAISWTGKVGAVQRQIRSGCVSDRICGVSARRHISQQRHPVIL